MTVILDWVRNLFLVDRKRSIPLAETPQALETVWAINCTQSTGFDTATQQK
jgi:hypothetical protein